MRLIQLLEVISGESLGKYNNNPRHRVQKAENVLKALNFIKTQGIVLTNIGAEDIIDGNIKLILGLLWTLISRFTIAEIEEEGLSAKEGLLFWCRRKTARYQEVDIQDFRSSWSDGLAFCALVHCHRPDLLDYTALDQAQRRDNITLAFRVAAEGIGIPQLLDVEDIDVLVPDERSVMTYVAQYFHAFAALDRIETSARRVEKFLEMTCAIWEQVDLYEKQMSKLLQDLWQTRETWKCVTFENYADAMQKSLDFHTYKRVQKRYYVASKAELESILGNIQVRLRSYQLSKYTPKATIGQLDEELDVLATAEVAYARKITSHIALIKNELRIAFAEKANHISSVLKACASQISSVVDSLENQELAVQDARSQLQGLDRQVEELSILDSECNEANIDENSYTVYSYDDLDFELKLNITTAGKRLRFIESQIADASGSLSTKALKDYEATFQHFNKSGTNLKFEEFEAALASLGIAIEEGEVAAILQDVGDDSATVSFDRFVRFMVDATEDRAVPSQVLQSFKQVAAGQPYVTKAVSQMFSDKITNHLEMVMPLHSSGEGLDYEQFVINLMSGKTFR